MSIAVNGLNSYVDPSMVSAASGTNLSGRLDQMDGASSADELKEVCREFESYFMEQVYKEMFKTIGSEERGDPDGCFADNGTIRRAAGTAAV